MAAATDNIKSVEKALNQDAVYWAPDSVDSYGQPTFASPEEIECRWDDVVAQRVMDNGEIELSIATLMVDRDLEVGGIVMLGELSSSVVEDDPRSNTGAWEIKRALKTPNKKGTLFFRQAYL